MWKYANPHAFMRLSGWLTPPVALIATALLLIGFYQGLYVLPDDYKQGDSARIMIVHVPAAAMSIIIYAVIAVSSIVGLIWRHPVAFLCAKSAAPIGAALTALALITGSIWGKPMWGTWWEWSPRLTSELVMFFFYIGYIALWSAYDDVMKGGDATSILALVGSVFAVLAKYSVMLLPDGTLHQQASLSMDAEEHMHDVYHRPLLMMIAAFYLYFIALLFVRMRMEIRLRRIEAMRAAAARAADGGDA